MPLKFLASVSAAGNLADLLEHLHVRTRVSPGPHPLTRVTAWPQATRVHTLATAAWHIATHFLCPCLTIFLQKFYINNHNWSFDFDYMGYGIHVLVLHWCKYEEKLCNDVIFIIIMTQTQTCISSACCMYPLPWHILWCTFVSAQWSISQPS